MIIVIYLKKKTMTLIKMIIFYQKYKNKAQTEYMNKENSLLFSKIQVI